MKTSSVKHFLTITLIIFISNSLWSATLTVCASGCNHTTITAAIAAASANDIIQINDATHTELNIIINKSNLTIQGQGQNTTTVQAHATQAMATERIFTVNTSITVTIQDLTLRHGNTSGRGGAILLNNSAAITLNRVTLTNNNGEDGGAISSASSTSGIVLNMTDCIVSNNIANLSNSSADGGGIYNAGGNLTMTNCTVSNNKCGDDGGAIFISESASNNSLTNCTITNNEANASNSGARGGGIHIIDGNLTVSNTTISNNTSGRDGGGLYFDDSGSSYSLTDCVIANNNAGLTHTDADGGAIWNSGGDLTMIRCSVINNKCGDDTGGIDLSGSGDTHSFTNCTISGNSGGHAGASPATVDAGGVGHYSGTVTLINCTIASNTTTGYGGGVSLYSTIHLTNNIFADNTAGVAGNDMYDDNNGGTISTNNNNLVETCAAPINCATFAVTSDPGLSVIGTCSGGTALTHSITSGSSAENAGTNTGAPTNDICGTSRNNPPDLGSFEIGSVLPVDLIFFKAMPHDNRVLLTWETAAEFNNLGFELLRSSNNQDWNVIDFVEGKGDSAKAQYYKTYDNEPDLGMNYYRLKQFDFDGTYEFSEIKSIDFSNFKKSKNLRIYPNPTERGKFTIKLPQTYFESAEMQLIDLTGKLVYETSLSNSETKIQLPNLTKGIYVIEVNLEGRKRFGRLVVQ